MEKTAMTAFHGPRCAMTAVPAARFPALAVNEVGRYGSPTPTARTDVDVTRPARGGPAV